ncbi:MAG: hypothetical protein IKQ61_03115 [Spirochaetales bacterium]|nr:hypothetical protein [Spirochaetales bacterium]MBR6199239.1 hypothetical protein [Spirochaetales bacterium]
MLSDKSETDNTLRGLAAITVICFSLGLFIKEDKTHDVKIEKFIKE